MDSTHRWLTSDKGFATRSVRQTNKLYRFIDMPTNYVPFSPKGGTQMSIFRRFNISAAAKYSVVFGASELNFNATSTRHAREEGSFALIPYDVDDGEDYSEMIFDTPSGVGANVIVQLWLGEQILETFAFTYQAPALDSYYPQVEMVGQSVYLILSGLNFGGGSGKESEDEESACSVNEEKLTYSLCTDTRCPIGHCKTGATTCQTGVGLVEKWGTMADGKPKVGSDSCNQVSTLAI
jgi:hypothetical protein